MIQANSRTIKDNIMRDRAPHAPAGPPRESGGEKLPHGSGRVVRLRRREIGAPTGGFPSLLWTEGVGDEGGGSVCAGSACLPCGGDEPAAGGAAVRDRPEDGGEDAALLGAAGLPAQQAAGAAQAGWVHRRSEERRVGKECRSRW